MNLSVKMSLAMNIPGGGGGPVVGIGGLDAILIHSLQQKKYLSRLSTESALRAQAFEIRYVSIQKNQLMKTDPMIKGLS